jgi:hypothetical protein
MCQPCELLEELPDCVANNYEPQNCYRDGSRSLRVDQRRGVCRACGRSRQRVCAKRIAHRPGAFRKRMLAGVCLVKSLLLPQEPLGIVDYATPWLSCRATGSQGQRGILSCVAQLPIIDGVIPHLCSISGYRYFRLVDAKSLSRCKKGSEEVTDCFAPHIPDGGKHQL